jgi:hypothetical protein
MKKHILFAVCSSPGIHCAFVVLAFCAAVLLNRLCDPGLKLIVLALHKF